MACNSTFVEAVVSATPMEYWVAVYVGFTLAQQWASVILQVYSRGQRSFGATIDMDSEPGESPMC